jgi:septal ring factor EnvC (AmiA/AmiB activator)
MPLRFLSQIGVFLVFLGLFWGGQLDVSAQNFDELRNKLRQEQNKARSDIEELQRQLKLYEEQISESEQKFEQMTRELVRLDKEIALRRQVISKLSDESVAIQKEMELTKNEISKTEKELAQLIENYQRVLTYLYKHGRISEVALLVAAESFSQFLSRSYYLKKFAEYRKKQTVEIEEKQGELKQKQEELEKTAQKNKSVLKQQKSEQTKLDDKRRKQDNLLLALQRNRVKLKNLLVTTQQEIKNLNATLNKLIAEEIKLRKAEEDRIKELEKERLRRLEQAKQIVDANKRKEEIAKYEKPIVSAASDVPNEAELKVIEESFGKQKGKLPWPVETGAISAKFGTIVHPVYKTKTTNYGIEIATEPKADVFAIHDGTVLVIVPIAGYGDVIIVNHGKYNSVYGNLSEVLIRKDMFVRAGDVIGKAGDVNSPKGTSVFLMIKNDKENLNPEQWISKK